MRLMRALLATSIRGAALEPVVKSVAEQRQIFKGADHALLWKSKLRISDIYEDADNQRALGMLLDTCCNCSQENTCSRPSRGSTTRR